MHPEQAITRQEIEDIVKSETARIHREIRRSNALIRETLWHASGKMPQYKPADGRSIGIVKESMVQTAIDRILGGETLSPSAIVVMVVFLESAYDAGFEEGYAKGRAAARKEVTR